MWEVGIIDVEVLAVSRVKLAEKSFEIFLKIQKSVKMAKKGHKTGLLRKSDNVF